MTPVRVVLAGVMVAALSATAAFANHVTVVTKTLGAGTAVVARCDTNSAHWTHVFTTDATTGKVNGASIGNIATSCVGGRLSATITDSGGSHVSSTASPVTILSGSCSGTCTEPVSFSTPEYPADVARLYLVVAGP